MSLAPDPLHNISVLWLSQQERADACCLLFRLSNCSHALRSAQESFYVPSWNQYGEDGRRYVFERLGKVDLARNLVYPVRLLKSFPLTDMCACFPCLFPSHLLPSTQPIS